MSRGTDDASPPSVRSALGRVRSLYPLLLAYLVLLTLYAWQTTKHSSPWLFVDELQWAALSRSVAHHGTLALRLQHVPFKSFYAYFLAPAWWLGSTAPGYAAAKYLNAAVMTASLFPAYGLARLFVPRRAALLCGIAAAATPSLAYIGVLTPEPLAYFWSTLVIWLLARALARPQFSTVVAAVVTLGVAPEMRGELAVLLPGAVVAAAIAAAASGPGRRLIGGWSPGERIGALTLIVLGAIWAGALVTHRSESWRIGTYHHHRLFTYGLWADGSFAIGVGVLPVFATLVWLLNARLRDAEERALFGTAVGTILAFGTYTAVKASYLWATFATRVEERDLIYIAPLVFVITARWAVMGRTRLVPGALAAGGIGYLLATTPYHINEHLYSDALGLAILQWLNRTWAVTTSDAQTLLFSILGGTLVAAAGRELVLERVRGPRLRVLGLLAGAVLAVLTLTWNLMGEIVAADASNSFAKSFLAAVPRPPDWIDRETGRARTMFIGESFGDPNAFWTLEFWNQSIQDVWSVDGTAPGPGPVVTPDFTSTDGAVAPQLPIDWAVASPAVELAGRVAYRAGGMTLYRLAHPIRLQSEYGGVAPDGWMGTAAWYERFGSASDRRGTVVVTLSRSAACGAIPPARITIRVSQLAIDKNRQPVAGRIEQLRHVTVHSAPCETRTVEILATPPFRIDLSANRTFQSSPSDRRPLSVVAAFSFRPS